MYPVTLRLIQKCFVPTYKWSMEISTYLVNINFETISEIVYRKVHGNFHVSYNIETNSEILYQKGRWKFPFTVPSNIETNSKMFLLKGSMEISMYPVILRLTNSLRKGSMEFVTERVHENFHVSCDIKFNLKKIITKKVHGNLVVTVTVMYFF